jgi:hypothetical protein
MAELRLGKSLAPIPAEVNYAQGMPSNLGFMLNDVLGDCVEAAAGHAIQLWSFNAARNMVTPPDSDIEAFYELAGGYVPGNPNTDTGTIEQVALKDWLNSPIDGNELAAFVEINQQDLNEVRRSIYECGLVFIGLNVPAYLQSNLEVPGSLWDVDPSGDSSIIGGHAVIVTGYDSTGNMPLISWGSAYTMTRAFFEKYVDECYALANPSWMSITGSSPAGMTIEELEKLMNSFIDPQTQKNAQHRHHRRRHRRYTGD